MYHDLGMRWLGSFPKARYSPHAMIRIIPAAAVAFGGGG
jgi:hypothetical protein